MRGEEGVAKRIDAGVLRWFGYVERMENVRIAKRVYVGECAVSHSVGRFGCQGNKKGVCEGECIGYRPGDEPLTLTRCHSCELPQLYEIIEG